MFIPALLALATTLSTHAACEFALAKDATKITWTAYKTPKKVAVGGEFKGFSITPGKSNASVTGLLEGATFTVDAATSTTGNPARDKTIQDNFFKAGGKLLTITGAVTKVTATEVSAKLVLGGQSKDVVFKRTEEGDVTKLATEVSMLDLGIKANYDGIAKACKALHEGVTWPEVGMGVEFKTTKTCK